MAAKTDIGYTFLLVLIMTVIFVQSYANEDNHPYNNTAWDNVRYMRQVYEDLLRTTKGSSIAHPCKRECIYRQPMTCYYHMVVHYDQTMAPSCWKYIETIKSRYNQNRSIARLMHPHSEYDEVFRSGSSYPYDCIYADGVNTNVIVVNGQLPGQAIEVCVGDTIVADVQNNLREETSIHWHGIRMKETPHMDGSPFVTQYPIYPGQLFRYKFEADHTGSNWWHSHSLNQRAFGLAGPLIVRRPKFHNPHAHRYDYEYTIMLQDWVHNLDAKNPKNILINGKGRNISPRTNDTCENVPTLYETFTVVYGRRYLFRIIYNGIANCPIKLSVDNHDLIVISSDGSDLEPIVANSIVLLAAERYDFILEAREIVDNYWIRVKSYGFCAAQEMIQEAVLHYKGASQYEMPNSLLSYSYEPTGRVLNPIDEPPSGDPNKITILDTSAIKPVEWQEYTPFLTVYVRLGVYFKNGEFSLQQDNISFKMPTLSLLQSRYLNIDSMLCNKTTLANEGRDCLNTNCKCTNVVKVPANAFVELVIAVTSPTGHPFHTHGYHFRVAGTGKLGPTNIWKIEQIDKKYPLFRRHDRAPIKDTVQVPGHGYAILRFKADNPGFWMFHCHIHRHSEDGMMAILQVGEHYQMKPTPVTNCGI